MTNKSLDFTDKFSLASPKKQILYPVSQREWERLKMMIRNILKYSNWCQMIWSVSVGIFVTSIFSLIGLYNSNQIVNWTIIIGWVVLGGSFVLSVACFAFDKFIKNRSCFEKDQIIDEMESIESSFDVTVDEGNERFDLSEVLTKNKWRLIFNPLTDASKIMSFDRGGVIRRGNNRNESSWQINNNALEFFDAENSIFSRFVFDFKKYRFNSTNDSDTRAIKNQYMILENQ